MLTFASIMSVIPAVFLSWNPFKNMPMQIAQEPLLNSALPSVVRTLVR